MNGRRGFTLVELLVVIAIIALLMAILMPALQLARRRAQGIYCRANMRSLSIAWTVYAQENDEKIASGEVWSNYNNVKSFDWVHPVISTSDPAYVSGMSGHERELAGIRKGALYPYTKNEEIYHCPGDRTWKEVTGTLNAQQSPYRSFATSWAMNGQWGGIDPKYKYKKIINIVRPSERFVFIEEEEAGGANWGSWVLDSSSFRWWDPIAIWHSGRSTNIGFADGHSEAHFWQDESTIIMGETQQLGAVPKTSAGEGEDLRFIERAFHHDLKNW